jgi:DNA repair protein RadC
MTKPPIQRLREDGPEYLTESELLKFVCGNISDAAIEEIDSKYTLKSLSRATIPELEKIPGIGPAKAAAIVSTFELSRKLCSYTDEPYPKIHAPADVYRLMHPKMQGLQKEHLIALHLNTKNRVIKEEIVSIGTLNSNLVHPREVFKSAIQNSAANIIILHNHPSGNSSPSDEDIVVTKKLVEGGHILGIKILDHLVIGDHTYTSMKDDGLVNFS